ncbi:hypothetical protein VTK26DRAFT_2361 [Humicola hyalothermophila]
MRVSLASRSGSACGHWKTAGSSSPLVSTTRSPPNSKRHTRPFLRSANLLLDRNDRSWEQLYNIAETFLGKEVGAAVEQNYGILPLAGCVRCMVFAVVLFDSFGTDPSTVPHRALVTITGQINNQWLLSKCRPDDVAPSQLLNSAIASLDIKSRAQSSEPLTPADVLSLTDAAVRNPLAGCPPDLRHGLPPPARGLPGRSAAHSRRPLLPGQPSPRKGSPQAGQGTPLAPQRLPLPHPQHTLTHDLISRKASASPLEQTPLPRRRNTAHGQQPEPEPGSILFRHSDRSSGGSSHLGAAPAPLRVGRRRARLPPGAVRRTTR